LHPLPDACVAFESVLAAARATNSLCIPRLSFSVVYVVRSRVENRSLTPSSRPVPRPKCSAPSRLACCKTAAAPSSWSGRLRISKVGTLFRQSRLLAESRTLWIGTNIMHAHRLAAGSRGSVKFCTLTPSSPDP
jgi:hypothetical protein